MSENIRFTEDTTVSFSSAEISDVHLDDLSFVLNLVEEEGEVTECEVDLHGLVQAMVLYSSMEKYRYGWRRASR